MDYKSIISPAIKTFTEKDHVKTFLLSDSIYSTFNPKIHEYLIDTHPKTKIDEVSKNTTEEYNSMEEFTIFLSVLRFLTKYWDPIMHPRPVLVFVGSAPGILFPRIFECFRSFEFHLYDPKEHAIEVEFQARNSPKIFIYKKFFGDDDINSWMKSDRNLFIIFNTKYQFLAMKAVSQINPLYSQIKFNCETAFSALDGKLYFRPWENRLSSTVDLVSSRPFVKNQYIPDIYQQMMFNHNTLTRNNSETKFRNIFDSSITPYHKIKKLGINNNWDGTITIHIVKEYLEKTSPTNLKFNGIEEMVYRFLRDSFERIFTLKTVR